MRNPKTILILLGSFVLAAILGLIGCGEDHRDHYYGDRDRERYERRDTDRHEDRGMEPRREGERGER